MYYVVKLSTVFKPTIVEVFENEDLAFTYTSVMNDAGKGNFIVLTDEFTKKAEDTNMISQPERR